MDSTISALQRQNTDMDFLPLALAIAAVIITAVTIFFLRGESARGRQQSDALAQAQAELAGRLAQMGEAHAATQAQLGKILEDRLDAMSKRIGDGLTQHSEKTGKTMGDLHERLAVIDSAQKKITDLSEKVVSLQDILSNKQARGAFGEIQLNDLVSSILPPSAYEFQATLGNNKRADCLLKLPSPLGPIVIDAKFPLESYQALRAASDDVAKDKATKAFRDDVQKHVKAIAERYIVPGETAESALMFLPSEAVFAELHDSFQGVVDYSHRRRVWIVSPTTLWATLNTVRAVLKDATMREQAGLIQVEVLKLLDDIGRLDRRVSNLDGHFNLAMKDIREIKISSDKVVKHGEDIQDIELGEDVPIPELSAPDSQDEEDRPTLVPFPATKD